MKLTRECVMDQKWERSERLLKGVHTSGLPLCGRGGGRGLAGPLRTGHEAVREHARYKTRRMIDDDRVAVLFEHRLCCSRERGPVAEPGWRAQPVHAYTASAEAGGLEAGVGAWDGSGSGRRAGRGADRA